DGDLVVAWASVNNQDGSAGGVFAQRYDGAGQAEGAEFLVNSYTTGPQSFPSVAAGEDGAFLVAWISLGEDGSNDAVVGQRYAALPVASCLAIPAGTCATSLKA